MVLLDRVEAWDAEGVVCRAGSHLDPGNPLRGPEGLGAWCALEYAMQAAALHGALRAGGTAQAAGYAAALRGVVLHRDRLDDPALGDLRVEARLEREEASGLIYALSVTGADGTPVVTGRASIALPAAGVSLPGAGA